MKSPFVWSTVLRPRFHLAAFLAASAAPWFLAGALAERTAMPYHVNGDLLDSGGAPAQSAGALYTSGGSLGGIGGLPAQSASMPAVTLRHGLSAQLLNVDVQVTLAESADAVAAGSSLTYTVTATNAGPDDATGVQITQALTLPAGVTLDSVTSSAGTSFADPVWTVGTLGMGGMATLTVVVNVAPSAVSGANVIADTATVSAIQAFDGDADNDSATERTSIDGKRYYDWRVEEFDAADLADPAKEATVWGPMANPDRDFRPNLFEFLHGSDPEVFDPDPAVTLGRDEKKTTFAFKKRIDLGGITFRFETSGTPGIGFTEIEEPASSAPAAEDGFNDVVYEDTVDVSEETPRFGQIVLEQE